MTLLAGGGGRAVAADQAEMELWATAKTQNTAAGFYRYLALYPSGDYVEQAIAALVDLKVIRTERQAPRRIPQANRPSAPGTLPASAVPGTGTDAESEVYP